MYLNIKHVPKAFAAGLIFLFLSDVSVLYAQHEISINAGGGLSTLSYSPAFGSRKNGFGGQAGFGYSYFFLPRLGFTSGMEFAPYSARFTGDSFSVSSDAVDASGDAFELRSFMTGLKEKHSASMLQIPLMLQYRIPAGKQQYFVAAGGKAGIPVGGKYSVEAGTVKNTAYYEEENYEYELQEFIGLGEFADRAGKGNLKLSPVFLISMETGMKRKLNEKWALLAGVYFDCGLNTVLNKHNPLPAVGYDAESPSVFELKSISYSVAGKITPVAAGIRIKLLFDISAKKEIKEPDDTDTETKIFIEREAARRIARNNEENSRAARDREAKRIADEESARKTAMDSEEARKKAEALKAVIMELQIPVTGYAVGQTDLNETQKQEWDKKIILLLEQDLALNLSIYGYTCPLGNEAVNRRVGMQRAEKAKVYLISRGVAEERILEIDSRRDTEPLVPNTSEENRKINRRVVIIIK